MVLAEELLDNLLRKETIDDVSSREWDEFHDTMDALHTCQNEQKKLNTAEEKYLSARNKFLGRST